MEVVAVGAFCFTLLLGVAIFFVWLRVEAIRRDLNRRLEQLERGALPSPTEPTPSVQPTPLTTPRPVQPPPPVAAPEPQPAPAVVTPLAASAPETPATAEAAPLLAAEPVSSAPPVARRPLQLPAPVTWFLQRHLLVQVGMVILFIGVAFLLKYAADQGWLSLELRHIGAAVGGVALAGVGWGLRKRARVYGLALQGGGLGIIYLTTFFAFGVYELIPGGLAFAIFVALGALCATLAVLNHAQILALMAMVGAFLAPFLASTGEGSHVALFSYYALVNAVVFAIAWFRAWRGLNVAGFLLTLAGGLAWGSALYEPALFATTEPFLLLFFAFYLAIAILYATRRRDDPAANRGADAMDITLVFGNPLAVFAIQAALVDHLTYGAAISALGLGLLYMALAGLAARRILPLPTPMLEAFLFLGYFFLALAVPLFFDAQVTAAIWALAGAGWVWMGVRRQRVWNVGWGVLVQLGAALAHLGARTDLFTTTLPLWSLVYLGAYLVGGAGLFSAYQVRKWAGHEKRGQLATFVAQVLAVWGMAWWFGGGADQVLSSAPQAYKVIGLVAFSSLSGAMGEWLGVRLGWFTLRAPLAFLLPVTLLLALLQLDGSPHHFASGGWAVWPLALAAHYWMAHRFDREQETPTRWQRLRHAGGLWLVALLFAWFAGWAASQWAEADTWPTVAVLIVLALLILVASEWAARLPGGFARYERTYRRLGAGPLVLVLLLWTLLFRADDSGALKTLPYIPLLNPLDLAYLFGFGVLLRWVRRLALANPTVGYVLWGVAAFPALNLVLARAVHHLTDVAYRWNALYDSPVLQTTYAIVWSGLALALMFWGSRRRLRAAWLFGAVVLALAILKLFVVDLASAETIARIVSFIGVGLLVLIIAYFAPAPATARPSSDVEAS